MWYIAWDKEYSGYFHGNLRFLALYLEVSATFNLRVTFIELKVLPKYSQHQWYVKFKMHYAMELPQKLVNECSRWLIGVNRQCFLSCAWVQVSTYLKVTLTGASSYVLKHAIWQFHWIQCTCDVTSKTHRPLINAAHLYTCLKPGDVFISR